MYIGRKIIFRDKVSSTNDLAAQLAKSGEASDGSIVWSHYQSGGRGQSGNRWESETGMNLTMSIILKPFFLNPEKQFLISKVISLALKDLLAESGIETEIKWPNDIYFRSDKIAGILIEHSVTGSIIDTSVCGVGLNVNQVRFTMGAPNPVSMKMVTGASYDIEELLSLLCGHLNYWYTRLTDGDYATIDTAYEHSLFNYSTVAGYSVSGLKIKGIIRGVDNWGRLLLEDEGGSVRKFAFKEISFIL